MKKILSCLLAILSLFALCVMPGCSTKPAEIALIIEGEVNDGSFCQTIWESVEAFAKSNKTSAVYYVSDLTEGKGEEVIENAIGLGAKTVVVAGGIFASALGSVQTRYPHIRFLIIDGEPADADGKAFVAKNSVGVTYFGQEAGFLAGYAAVYEGYRSLGFIGGKSAPAVIDFGYGFVQGVEYAGRELKLDPGMLNIKYYYSEHYNETAELTALAKGWYEGGVEVVFCAGGGNGFSVMKAAETTGKAVIGVDTDQSALSNSIIFSAVKNYKLAVEKGLSSFYSGTPDGGKTIRLGAANDGAGLAFDQTKLKHFTADQYKNIVNAIADGSVLVHDHSFAESVLLLGTVYSKVEVITDKAAK